MTETDPQQKIQYLATAVGNIERFSDEAVRGLLRYSNLALTQLNAETTLEELEGFTIYNDLFRQELDRRRS